MLVRQLISTELPVLEGTDTGDKALQLMQEFQLSHLPLVDRNVYKALISEEYLLNWSTPGQELSTANFLNFQPVVYGHLHPYEALARAIQQNISLVPVIDDAHQYTGSVSRNSLLAYLYRNSGLEKPGGIITLEVSPAHYSLSEIARICENNDVIVLNTQVFTYPEKDTLEVTLKTNSHELQSLVASFERYEYVVKEVFGEMPAYEGLQERYKLLMNYINM